MSLKTSGPKLDELCDELLERRNLIIASNRGPIDFYLTEDGGVRWQRGSGGVVTALSSVANYMELTWISSAMGEGDRRAAEQAYGKRFKLSAYDSGNNLNLRFVRSPGAVYHKFYSVFCNPLLWFLQHGMWNASHTPNIDARVRDAWETGYKEVNRTIAEAVVAEASESELPPLVMLHDYHLYLAARYIRESLPNVIIQHFTHIPWPGPYDWQLLPRDMCKDICEGLCANDIVGLQTSRDVHNFLHTCEVFLKDADIDYKNRNIVLGDRIVKVRAYPISIDVTNVQKHTRSAAFRRYEENLKPFFGEKTIMRVDRLEPSKNIVRGFRSFDMLLQRYPELVRKVKFLAFLVPSRARIKQYRRYAEEVSEAIETVNAKYGDEEWQPITVFYENNYVQALAAMSYYDVLLVNPVNDGMNLVSKEGPVVNKCDGVLVLSETAGAFEQLREDALTVTPTDLDGMTDALYRALTMAPDEKKRRASSLKKSIKNEDIALWLNQQLCDVTALALDEPQQNAV
ncbi:MAG: trehalose-6-phosphate synthase [Chloroflexota bacterium]|nr:trehalose-6-phosphate synthase [Chloroflexota bacterium]